MTPEVAVADPVTTAPPPSFSVYCIEPDCAESVWHLVEPHLARAVARERGRFTLNDVRRWVTKGEQQLWVVTENRKTVIAAGLVRLYIHPSGKRAAILHSLGGSRPREWAVEAFKSWSGYCRRMGIMEMQIVGRKGWARVVRHFGFQQEAVILTREEF